MVTQEQVIKVMQELALKAALLLDAIQVFLVLSLISFPVILVLGYQQEFLEVVQVIQFGVVVLELVWDYQEYQILLQNEVQVD